VRIEGTDRPGLERLLRYCARPAFVLARWREIDAEQHLLYEGIEPGPGGDWPYKRSARQQRIAALRRLWQEAMHDKAPGVSADEVLDRLERKYHSLVTDGT